MNNRSEITYATSPSEEGPHPRNGHKTRVFLGSAFILLILGLNAWLFTVRGDDFRPQHWKAFNVSIALVTGLAFWLYSPGASGQFTNRMLGIRLGGAAAIGASFMMLAGYLRPEAPPSFRIVDGSVPGVDLIYPLGHTEGIDVTRLRNGSRFLVEFDEGTHDGEFYVGFLRSDGSRWKRIFAVPRTGKLPSPQEIQVTE